MVQQYYNGQIVRAGDHPFTRGLLLISNLPPEARFATGLTWHLSPEPHWAAHAGKASYTPEHFAEDGFIHCTDGDERLIEVGNRYYTADLRPFLALQVDLDAAGSPAIYEDPEHVYPHIYGELDTAAVREVRRIVRAADGTFLGIGEVVEAASDPGAPDSPASEGPDRH